MADNESKQPKRRLKNAETVRERAIKAQEQAASPRKRRFSFMRAIGTVLSWPIRIMARPFRKVTGLKLWHRQPFRLIGKLLRVIGRILFLSYLRTSWRELKLVTWPNRKQSRQLTFAVIIFAVVFGAIVSGLDYGLDKLFKQVLVK